MKRPEADRRELAKAVDRVHRVDASMDVTLRELRRVSQRQLVSTSAALGLGVAALATLSAIGKTTRGERHPVRASSRRPVVSGVLATLAPWAFDLAFRHFSPRPTRAAGDSARNRFETDRRNEPNPATQGDPE